MGNDAARVAGNDSRREVLKRSIEQAKAQSGEDNTQLSVTINLPPEVERQLPPTAVLVVSVTDGVAPIPVAVKQLPLGHFPVTVSLSDANAMMPERLLSAQKQVKVRARISRDGLANPQPGDWFGESAVMPYNKQSQISVQIDHQVP